MEKSILVVPAFLVYFVMEVLLLPDRNGFSIRYAAYGAQTR